MGLFSKPPPPPPAPESWIDEQTWDTIEAAWPFFAACTLGFFVATRWRPEMTIAFYGFLAFDLTTLAHVIAADDFKKASGFLNLTSDAFGSFTTLLGLVFSILLGQTYQYYFDRQGAIQDSAYREICAVSRLLELVRLLDPPQDARRKVLSLLRNYVKKLLESGLSHGARLVYTSDDTAMSPDAPPSPAPPSSAPASPEALDTFHSWDAELAGALKLLGDSRGTVSDSEVFVGPALIAAHTAVRDIDDARAVRVSNINADLPPAQWVTLNLLGGLLVVSFLLLDLEAPKLEATLFGAICASAFVFVLVIHDLGNPFEGNWSVTAAASEVQMLEKKIDLCWQETVGNQFGGKLMRKMTSRKG